MDGASAGIIGGLVYFMIKGLMKKLNGWRKYLILFFLVFTSFTAASTMLSGNSFSIEILKSSKLWIWVLSIYAVLAFFEAIPYLDKKINGNN